MSLFSEDTALIQDLYFSEGEQQQLFLKLWELLKCQVESYNGIDSTSITEEKAQELLASMLYTIMLVISVEGHPREILLSGNLSLLLQNGQEILKEKLKSVKEDWNHMCLSAPQIQNYYYIDTVKNLGVFFKRYDLYYMAHQIPCSIDYPLMEPVSEEIKGISYVEEYLRRITIENKFLNNFDIKTLNLLYERSIPDFKSFFFNLCEPVLMNAIGRVMLGLTAASLNICKEEQKKLVDLLGANTNETLLMRMCDAARLVYKEFDILDEEMKIYFDRVIPEIVTRVNATLKTGDLSHVFVSFL